MANLITGCLCLFLNSKNSQCVSKCSSFQTCPKPVKPYNWELHELDVKTIIYSVWASPFRKVNKNCKIHFAWLKHWLFKSTFWRLIRFFKFHNQSSLLMKSFIQCDYWNSLERIIIEAVDSVAPLKSVKISLTNKCKSLPPNVKMKLNRRKRLLRSDRLNNINWMGVESEPYEAVNGVLVFSL